MLGNWCFKKFGLNTLSTTIQANITSITGNRKDPSGFCERQILPFLFAHRFWGSSFVYIWSSSQCFIATLNISGWLLSSVATQEFPYPSLQFIFLLTANATNHDTFIPIHSRLITTLERCVLCLSSVMITQSYKIIMADQ